MRTISELHEHVGEDITLHCRATLVPRTGTKTTTDTPRMKIADMTGEMEAGLAHDYQGPSNLDPLSRVQLHGHVTRKHGNIAVTVRALELLSTAQGDSLRMLPRQWCPRPELLPKLHKVKGYINNFFLKWLIDTVFADNTIASKFVSIPASAKQHHSYAAGLLQHSLECAVYTGRFLRRDPEMRDIAVTAALLHDLGKIYDYDSNNRRIYSKIKTDHRDVTYELIEPHIKDLELFEPGVLYALRYILSLHRADQTEQRRPLYPAAMIVHTADRYSAAKDAERLAFRKAAVGATTARLSCAGPRNLFRRPSPPLTPTASGTALGSTP